MNAVVSQSESYLDDYDRVRLLLAGVALQPSAEIESVHVRGMDQRDRWHSMWSSVASRLLEYLETGSHGEFDAAFRLVGDALAMSGSVGREMGAAALFGDFTRRAIAAGLDRRRCVDWLVPAEVFMASPGRARGRVLYFDAAKGRGKILGVDGTVYFVHFAMIRSSGFRSLEGGQLVEFTPRFGAFNSGSGWAASDTVALAESGSARSS